MSLQREHMYPALVCEKLASFYRDHKGRDCALHRVTGITDKFPHRDILRNAYVMLSYVCPVMPPNWVFQHHNDANELKYTAVILRDILRFNHVSVMGCVVLLSQSPDLSPIENIWSEIKRRLRATR